MNVATNEQRPRRKKIGRPRALTARTASRIVATLKKGAPYRLAAAAGGVSTTTLWAYRDPTSPTYDAAFAARCADACEIGLLRMYEQVARSTDWRAVRWRMECAAPQEFGRRTIVAGDRDNPVRVEIDASFTASAHIRSDRSLLMALIKQFATEAVPLLPIGVAQGEVHES
jgi:hypothetical protein